MDSKIPVLQSWVLRYVGCRQGARLWEKSHQVLAQKNISAWGSVIFWVHLSGSPIRLVSFLREATRFSREASNGKPSHKRPETVTTGVIWPKLGEEFLSYGHVGHRVGGWNLWNLIIYFLSAIYFFNIVIKYA